MLKIIKAWNYVYKKTNKCTKLVTKATPTHVHVHLTHKLSKIINACMGR